MKNNIIYKSLIFGFVALFASCESYLDVNESPNDALYAQIPPDLTLSAALSQSSRLVLGDSRNVERGSVGNESTNALGNLMLNSWAGNVNSFTGVFAGEYFSNITAAFYDNIWNYGYTNIANFQKIVDYKQPGFEKHKAIAQIMKVYYMQNIVDLYGDCPYSEAFKGNDNLFPKYDDDRNIYENLYKELDQALAIIASGQGQAVGFEDVMCGGVMNRWRQLANTLKLRLVIRQRLMTSPPAYVAGAITALGALGPLDFLTADITINPGYNKTSNDRQNPFYANYGFNITGVGAFNRNLVCASDFAATKLNLSGDARRVRLFTPISGNVVGIIQGANSGGSTPTTVSLLGPAIVPVPTGVAPNLDSTVGSTQNGFLLTLSETKFLLAEAANFYPAFSSYNAQTLFNEGVVASFIRLGAGGATVALQTAAANSYLTANLSNAGIGWNSGTNALQSIMYQKWVSLMSVNAGESWIEYVRTGFPVVPNAITNILGKPKRLLYPTSETVANSANVPAQTSASAFASGPFWK